MGKDRAISSAVTRALARDATDPPPEELTWPEPRREGPFVIPEKTRLRECWIWRRNRIEWCKQFDYPIDDQAERRKASEQALRELVERVAEEESWS